MFQVELVRLLVLLAAFAASQVRAPRSRARPPLHHRLITLVAVAFAHERTRRAHRHELRLKSAHFLLLAHDFRLSLDLLAAHLVLPRVQALLHGLGLCRVICCAQRRVASRQVSTDLLEELVLVESLQLVREARVVVVVAEDLRFETALLHLCRGSL